MNEIVHNAMNKEQTFDSVIELKHYFRI